MRDLSKYSRDDIECAIDQWVICHKHAERNRYILKRHLLGGICYEPLSEEVGMLVRQVKNIVYKTQEMLLKHL